MRVLLRRLLRYPVVPGVVLAIAGLWQIGGRVVRWVYGGWGFYDFAVQHFGPLPPLDWLLDLPAKPWFPLAVLVVGLAWIAVGLWSDAVFRRAQVLTPTLQAFIGLSNTIQREMIHEPNKHGTVGQYAARIDRDWRGALGAYLNRELPAATQVVLEKLGPAGAPPFEWEFLRLQHCANELKRVLANLDYWIRLSEVLRQREDQQ